MKINHKKVGEMNADPKSANFKVLNPDGPPVEPGVRDGHPPLPRQDGTTPAAPIPTPSTPAGQPASTQAEASSPTPSATAPEELKKRDKAAADGTSSTPANQTPGDSGEPSGAPRQDGIPKTARSESQESKAPNRSDFRSRKEAVLPK